MIVDKKQKITRAFTKRKIIMHIRECNTKKRKSACRLLAALVLGLCIRGQCADTGYDGRYCFANLLINTISGK
jgi:hypothetical protein